VADRFHACSRASGASNNPTWNDVTIDLNARNKIGFRSTLALGTATKQYWLVPVFDPISEYSLGGAW
jgi:hypothetical protein